MKKFGVALFILVFTGCATYQNKLELPRNMMRQGQVQGAITLLQDLAAEPSGDQLVYLMELGMALHIDGQYDQSNKVFLRADKLADEADYTSVSRTALATLSSESALQYKGESYEKLLINAYLAMNFLMLGKYDSALVEVRRVNQKIQTLRSNGRENYEYNPLSHYLSALIYEGDRKFDDAYIEYEKVYELEPNLPKIGTDLIRSATLAQRPDALKKWQARFPNVPKDPAWSDRQKGEIVFIYQQGWGPKKVESRGDHRFPELQAEYSQTDHAVVMINGPGAKEVKVATEEIYNLERNAIETLRADYAWMVARKVGAFVAKEVVADQIRQKDELLGLVAQIAMHVTDRADLRHWSTLPRTFQIARFKVMGGDYQVSAQGMSGGNTETADALDIRTVKVRPGRITFITWRSLR